MLSNVYVMQITIFIVQWNPINTVTNGLEIFGHNITR